jgi:hypothetical protein
MVMSAFIQAAVAETATGDLSMEATLDEALTVSCGTSLDFGTVTVANGASGTVTVDTAGSGTYPNNISQTGTDMAGACTISGNNENSAPTVTINAAQIDKGNDSLTVNNFTDNADSSLDNGNGVFNIGGDLVIPDGFADFGNYSGTVTVTVDDGT